MERFEENNLTTILVVDDDMVCREFLQAVLFEMGYHVLTASDGDEALEIIANSNVRIVLSDWQMPNMDGTELCRRIRKRRLSNYIYFILLTTMERNANVVAGLEAGADDFLSKPCSADELLVRLKVAERLISLEKKHLLVFSLAKLAESRDTDTGAHLERIRDYCWALAYQLSKTEKYRDEIDGDFIRALYLTSPLHDIGKVGIPDAVLLKPGKLTKEEFEIMKTHAAIGRDTLAATLEADPNAQYLQLARDIAGSHHERYDGSGYPDGLSGEEIPLCARIVSLADVYDALTTKRVYKDAFTHEHAREIILSERGKQFDPDVVEAFIAVEQQIIDIKNGKCDVAENAEVGNARCPIMNFDTPPMMSSTIV